jgi:hypothetical protein
VRLHRIWRGAGEVPGLRCAQGQIHEGVISPEKKNTLMLAGVIQRNQNQHESIIV